MEQIRSNWSKFHAHKHTHVHMLPLSPSLLLVLVSNQNILCTLSLSFFLFLTLSLSVFLYIFSRSCFPVCNLLNSVNTYFLNYLTNQNNRCFLCMPLSLQLQPTKNIKKRKEKQKDSSAVLCHVTCCLRMCVCLFGMVSP